MRIGIITFHWTRNYGAVLQAYALQHHLIQNGYGNVEIINYIPLKYKVKDILSLAKHLKVYDLLKEIKINKFRKNNFILSEKKYFSNNLLRKNCHDYDVYICGSDQIWNEFFTLKGEGEKTLSYFLNFVPKEKIKISYAASFGTERLTMEVANLIRPELNTFKSISVRGNSARKIIQDLGYKSEIVLDPSFLLDEKDYLKLYENININRKYQLFTYFLHDEQEVLEKKLTNVFAINKNKKNNPFRFQSYNVEEFLYYIKNAEFFATNSYHGMLFSLIFHTPFIVFPFKGAGAGMNDRLETILNLTGLGERMVKNENYADIEKIIKCPIEWEIVDKKIDLMRNKSIKFIEKALN